MADERASLKIDRIEWDAAAALNAARAAKSRSGRNLQRHVMRGTDDLRIVEAVGYRRSCLIASFDQKHGKAGSLALQCNRKPYRAGANNAHIVLSLLSAQGSGAA